MESVPKGSVPCVPPRRQRITRPGPPHGGPGFSFEHRARPAWIMPQNGRFDMDTRAVGDAGPYMVPPNGRFRNRTEWAPDVDSAPACRGAGAKRLRGLTSSLFTIITPPPRRSAVPRLAAARSRRGSARKCPFGGRNHRPDRRAGCPQPAVKPIVETLIRWHRGTIR